MLPVKEVAITQDMLDNDIVLEKEIFDQFPNRVIVAGTRGYCDEEEFSRYMDSIVSTIQGKIIFISGAASSGADALIINYARRNNYLCWKFKAQWDAHGKGAGFIRNSDMARRATQLIAFYDGKSNGTGHMISEAIRLKLDYTVVTVTIKEVFEICTTHISRGKKLRDHGFLPVDITVKSGIIAFAPDARMLMKYKNGEVTVREYEDAYRHRMHQMHENVKMEELWQRLLKHKKMSFLCYCSELEYCHRHAFADLAHKYLKANGYAVKDLGEIGRFKSAPYDCSPPDTFLSVQLPNDWTMRPELIDALPMYIQNMVRRFRDHTKLRLLFASRERADSFQFKSGPAEEIVIASGEYTNVDGYVLVRG